MSFDLTSKRLAWIRVPFSGFASEGDKIGQPVEHVVELQVDLVDLDEFGRLFVSPLDENGDPRPDAIPPATPERLEEWAKINDTTRALAIVHDWRGVKSGGVKTPFTPEGLASLMKVPNFASGLFLTAYPSAYAGLKDTRSGNSDSSPANGAASADAE